MAPVKEFKGNTWATTLHVTNITDNLTSCDISLHKARDKAQNCSFWRLLASHNATHLVVHDIGFARDKAALSGGCYLHIVLHT